MLIDQDAAGGARMRFRRLTKHKNNRERAGSRDEVMLCVCMLICKCT